MATSLHLAVEQIQLLKRAVMKPGSVPAGDVLTAVIGVEKARPALLREDWPACLSAPGKRWRLIYTAGTAVAFASHSITGCS